ncbi:MAG: hypothetical protein IPG42_21250 [Betaproteobacteria bacterium]|nr:hypothetical protein [Betaproteobacteria bacterium]
MRVDATGALACPPVSGAGCAGATGRRSSALPGCGVSFRGVRAGARSTVARVPGCAAGCRTFTCRVLNVLVAIDFSR